MKFVHLTPQPNVARVKKNGIRSGNGRRGRGVYAVPLMMMQKISLTDDDQILQADARSSMTLWKWLSGLRDRHRSLAAIVFRTTDSDWPVDLYLEISADIGTDWQKDLPSDRVAILSENLQFVRDANSQGFCADLKMTICDENSLGKVLQIVQSAGFKTWDEYDESIEIVFPYPINANQIDRITPLYRTNRQFKEVRQRDTTVD